MNRESEGKSRGIPHLAKNERDVGHPSLVRESEAPLVNRFSRKHESPAARSHAIDRVISIILY
jgi:hypothetical protein